MRTCLGLWLLLLSGLCSCQALDTPPQNSRECLGMARSYLEQGDYDLTLAALETFDPETMSLDDQSLWYFLAGTADFRNGDPWGAYDRVREFAIKRQFRVHSEQIANLLYEAGETLARSDGGFWIFWNDRQMAKTVLRDFVSYYPTNLHKDDAVYRLGELAFEDGDFETARLRFAQINVDSVWNSKSLYRVAMCYYYNLHGPDYDLAEMQQAHNELSGFLDSSVENPQYRAAANAALLEVKEMLTEKHIMLADFYFEVENQIGGMRHLRHAADDHPDTKAAQRARIRLTGRQDPAGSSTTKDG